MVTVTVSLPANNTIFNVSFYFLSVLYLLYCTHREVVRAVNDRRKSIHKSRTTEVSDEKESGGLQAVKLQFVVSDQAICKHEGAVLLSWQKYTEGEGKKMKMRILREKQKGKC